jgi:hypothetical protein
MRNRRSGSRAAELDQSLQQSPDRDWKKRLVHRRRSGHVAILAWEEQQAAAA